MPGIFMWCVWNVRLWYWSCPLSRNRDRIISHRTNMPRGVHKYVKKNLSQVGLKPTTWWFCGRCSTGWATAADGIMFRMLSVFGLRPKCGQWKCCIVGYCRNRTEVGWADKPPSLNEMCTYEICMRYEWDMYEIFMWYVWDVYVICMRSVCDIYEMWILP